MARYSGSQKSKKERNRDLLASVHYAPGVKLKVNDNDPSTYVNNEYVGPGPANPNWFRKVSGERKDHNKKNSIFVDPSDTYSSRNKNNKNLREILKLMGSTRRRILGLPKPTPIFVEPK